MELANQKSPLVKSKLNHKVKSFIYLGGLVVAFIASAILRLFTGEGDTSNIVSYSILNMGATALFTLITAGAVEFLYNFLNKEEHKLTSYLNSAAIALTITMLMPLATRTYPAIIATIVAVYLGKLVFGGDGHGVFNPAALGVAFASISWMSGAVAKLSKFIGAEYPLQSITNIINGSGSSIAVSSVKLLLGTYSDVAVGVSSAVVLLAVLVVFLLTKVADWKLSVTYIVASAAICALAAAMNGWDVNGVSGTDFLIANICSGMLLFVATFLISDSGSTPTSRDAKFIIATFVAVMTMAIRFIGAYTDANMYLLFAGECFALLLGNMLSPLINSIFKRSTKKSLLISLGVCVLLVVAASLGFGGAM